MGSGGFMFGLGVASLVYGAMNRNPVQVGVGVYLIAMGIWNVQIDKR